MPKSKDKWVSSGSKQQPFNINIEFNINPKNVTHHRQSSEVKIVQKMSHSTATNHIHNRIKKTNKEVNELIDSERSDKIDSKKQSVRQTQLKTRFVQKMKKCFIEKINNIDIILDPKEPVIQHLQNKEQRQSIMSAKLVPFHNQIFSKTQEEPQIKLNTLNIKSKMLKNKQASKIQEADHQKLYQLNSKKIDNKGLGFSHNKLSSKIVQHQRGFSSFTDIKSNRTKLNKKKNMNLQSAFKKSNIVKQPNLKEKLERFKLDMMKLAHYYQQDSVLKTKISSQNCQARSKQISKEIIDVYKIAKEEQHQKLHQIKQFQAKRVKLFNFIQPPQANLNNDETGEIITKHKNTEDLIQYYSQSENYYNQSENAEIVHEKKQISDSIQMMSSIQPKDRSFQKSSSQIHSFQITKNPPKIEEFLSYLLKSKLAQQLKDSIKQIYTQFNATHELNEQASQTSSLSENQLIVYSSVDDLVNKQIALIPLQRNQLCQESLKSSQKDEIHIWENNYKEELLDVKRKFWKQYKMIKDQIEDRIVGQNTCQLETRRSMKRRKIMKCLSQCSLPSHLLINRATQQFLTLTSPSHKDKEYTPITNAQFNAEKPYLKYEIASEKDLVLIQDDENKESQPQIIPLHEQIKNTKPQQTNQFIRLRPVQMKKISQDDIQDVFEFIFIDMCIEIYTDALSYEKSAYPNTQNTVLNSHLRILKYLRTCAQSKKIQNSKKIGISTNYLTTKDLLKQMIQFLTKDIKVYNSEQTNKQRIITKLNSSLGPAETAVLKSLRLSLFENEVNFDPNVEIQENDLLILQPELFIYFQYQIIKIKDLRFERYYNTEELENERINFLRNCTHIHNKAIFDCLNEVLDFSRVYGIWGKPFIWKNCPGLKQQLKQTQLVPILEDSMAIVLTCTTYVCGIMVDKQQSKIKGLAEESQYVRRLHDERMHKLLTSYGKQLQLKWYFHDDEEAEILIELSHLVWSVLIRQFLQDIINLNR